MTEQLIKLSTSAIKTYESCHRKYFYSYIEKPAIDEKDWSHLILGNFVHEVLELFHNILIEDPTKDFRQLMSYACQVKAEKQDYVGKLSPEIKESVKEILFSYLNNLEVSGLPNVQANEKRFSIEIDKNLLIRGVIDRVDIGINGYPELYHVVDYKGLALDTKIPTPSGWSTMGDLKVDDLILGSDGKPVRVSAKSRIHNRPCYRLTFSDKTSVVADNVHNWKIGYRTQKCNGNYDKVMSTDELYSLYRENGAEGTFVIENSDPIHLEDAALPIDPWLLGAWLGDGLSETGTIVVGKQDFEEMSNLIMRHWGKTSITSDKDTLNLTCVKRDNDSCSYGHVKNKDLSCKDCVRINNGLRLGKVCSRDEQSNLPLRGFLRKEGLLHNKHIPHSYLRGSFNQRLQLLRGLMDTDGSWNKQRNRAVFVSARKELFDGVVELVRSFGVTAQTFKATDKEGRFSYRLEFRPVGFNPFLLPRKSRLVEKAISGVYKTCEAKRRKIVSVEQIETVPTQCITVDADDSLYLCGEGFIPTHNTGKSKYLDPFQLLVYGIPLIEENPHLESYQGSYLALKEDKVITYRFTKDDVEDVKDKIRQVANMIRTDKTWEPNPQFLCNYCDYEKICPASPRNSAQKARGGEVDWE